MESDVALIFLIRFFLYFCSCVFAGERACFLTDGENIRTHTHKKGSLHYCENECLHRSLRNAVRKSLFARFHAMLSFFFLLFKKGKREEEALLRGAKLVSAVHTLCCVSYFTVVILPFPLVPFFLLTETKNERLLTSTQGSSARKN